MKDLPEIIRVLREEKELRRKDGITDIGLFGSYARGEAVESSDVDVLVDLSDDSPLTLFSLIGIEQSLSEKLDAKVDLVLRRDLKPEIGKRVLSEVRYV